MSSRYIKTPLWSSVPRPNPPKRPFTTTNNDPGLSPANIGAPVLVVATTHSHVRALPVGSPLASVSFELFTRSPHPLKAGIVATAFRRFMEFSMYRQRCIIAGSVVACSACDLIRPAASPYLSPCILAETMVKHQVGP